jgi:outer membrane protein assembly factor BamB
MTGQLAPLPIRLWPGVAAVTLQWLVRFAVPVAFPDAIPVAFIGGLLGGAAVLLWWLALSRAPWIERIGVLVLMAAALFAASRLAHVSVATGMMGLLLPIYAIPVLSLALVVWAAATRRLSVVPRRFSMVAVILATCGFFVALQTGGITGNAESDFHWRWTQTPEQRLLAIETRPRLAPPPVVAADAAAPIPAQAPVRAASTKPSPSSTTSLVPGWPGFRGPARDGVVRGLAIATDWSASPPVELWRRPVGPGWSSFAVHGNRIFTQEQRGDEEVVACYDARTGHALWKHGDPARFWESNGGAGPRATPALGGSRVYTFGATGLLNALEAASGAVVWKRDVAADTKARVPAWGFAGSPLVHGDLVVVAASGVLAAYDRETGEPRWSGPSGGWGYSSPHWAMIGGTAQVLLMNGAGAIGVSPSDGTLLWRHEWRGDGIVQPAVSGGDILIGTGSGLGSGTGVGVRRIGVSPSPDGWMVEERWTSAGLKPYFNDFVIHRGHAFGFDGSILSCIDLTGGARQWKGGRYGHGQLILLPEQDLLLVLSEEGELALVRATPSRFEELARVSAIQGKTWNHPALVGNVVFVRNGEEMAAFRLPVATR